MLDLTRPTSTAGRLGSRMRFDVFDVSVELQSEKKLDSRWLNFDDCADNSGNSDYSDNPGQFGSLPP